MTVPLGQSKIIYTADGVRKEWDIPFVFRAAADLKVFVSDDTGVYTPLSGGMRVETRENVKTLVYPTEPGVSALAAGRKILILRQTPLEQTVSFTSLANPDPHIQEEGLDRNVLMIQELAEAVDRAVKFPPQVSAAQTDAAQYLEQLHEAEQMASSANESAESALASAQQTMQTALQAAEVANQTVAQLEQYASSAQSGASASTLSAAQAADSAQLAQKWAVQTDQEVQEGQGYGAKKYALDAAASAAQAQQSAQGAARSAEASSSSASAAQTSETAAQGYSANADAKAAQAQNYAQAAQTSAADALSSAQDAAQSAQNSRGFAIGTVYYSQSSLATDNPGALPLWTGEYYANGAALYPDFYAWVKRHTELCTTKADYDARLAQYGEVPFYVVDEAAGSLRLPKLSNYIKMASSAQGITQTNAGLPNITGQVAIYIRAQKGRGAFSTPSDSAANAAEIGRVTLNDEGTTAFFDASKSNAIYGASDSVTPAHTTLYPWVAAYNAAVPASTAQAAEFQQGLLNKISKTGDTMSGQLQMTVGSHGVRFNVDDTKFFWIESNAANGFTLLNQDLKGIYLDGGNNGMPVYTPGPGMSYAILHTGYKNEIVGWSMPNYAAGIELPAAAYTAPKDGLFVITISQKVQTVNQKETTFYINGNKVAYAFVDYQNNPVLQFLLSKGDVLSASVYTSWLEQRFFPFKGAN